LVMAWLPQGSGTAERAFVGPLGGPFVDLAPGAGMSRAHDINDAGQVCIDVDGAPMRYTPGVGLQAVGPHMPERINDFGQMAGRDGNGLVQRYTDGIGWQAIAGASSTSVREVGGINSFGQVVATEYV